MKEEKMANYNLVAGIDVGNGYIKSRVTINDATFDCDAPSCVAYMPASAWVPQEPTDELMQDLFNELDCDVMSDSVAPADRKRILVGRRAATSGRIPIMFDINDSTPKCDDSLSGQFVCSVLATAALQKYWNDNFELPKEMLSVDAYVALALPIVDYVRCRERYRSMFVHGSHVVHVHNFDDEISVRITFKDVYVLPEGAAAQFAIGRLAKDTIQCLIDDAAEHGLPQEGETPETLISYSNTIGVDIGEGTVNFPVFRAGKINVEASSSINRGYGTVLSDVVESMRGTGFAPDSRKELSEFMLKKNPTPRDKKIQARLQRVLDDAADVFARDVIAEYTRVLRRTKLTSDVVWVYGGGADAIKDILWPRLVEASELDDDIYTPVMYLSSDLSRTLNRDGLWCVADRGSKRP